MRSERTSPWREARSRWRQRGACPVRSREAPCPSTLALGGPWESSPVCAGARGRGRRPGRGNEPGSCAGIWSPPLGGGWGPATQLSAGGQRAGWGGISGLSRYHGSSESHLSPAGWGCVLRQQGSVLLEPVPHSRETQPPAWRQQHPDRGSLPYSGKVLGGHSAGHWGSAPGEGARGPGRQAAEEALPGHAVSLVPALATCIPEGPWPPAAAGSSPWEPGLGLGSALPLRLPDFPGCGRLGRDGFCWPRAF